jgi:hypothetical protein
MVFRHLKWFELLEVVLKAAQKESAMSKTIDD